MPLSLNNSKEPMTKKNSSSLQNQPIPQKKPVPKYCGFCKTGMHYMDYKNPEFLKIFLNPQAKILPRRYKGNCRKHQKSIAVAIKRARHLALLAYVADNLT